jgi:large repetitive protein
VDNDFSLTYTVGSNGTLSGVAYQVVTSGAYGTAITATPNAGYSFAGWSDGVTTATRTDSNITANKSVTANFSLIPLTVTINQAAGQVDPSLATNLNYTVVFSEAISPASFIAADITLEGTGTGTVGTPVTQNNIVWNVPVTGTTPGIIIATIKADKVIGAIHGNNNTASTSTDSTITYGPDTLAPTVTLNSFVSPTKDATPSFSGTVNDNIGISSVVASIDNNDFTAIFNNGIWNFTTNSLSDGTHTIKVKATDIHNNIAFTDQQSFVVDTSAPSIPTVNSLTTNDNTPTITGSCEFSSDIKIDVHAVIYQVSCAANGSWDITLVEVPDGMYDVMVTSTDMAGNESRDITNNELAIKTTVPVLVEVTAVPIPGNDSTPNYTFSASEIGEITYTGDCAAALTTATVNINTITLNTLADGTYSNCTIQLRDRFNNPSNLLAISPFVIDTSTPIAPLLNLPSTSNDSTPDITGTCEAGGTLNIDVAPMNQAFSTPCSSTGTFTTTTEPIDDGEYTLSAKQIDPAGNQSPTVTATGFIDTVTPLPPVIVTPISGTSLNINKIKIEGTGEINAQIKIKDEFANVLCTASVNATGNWYCTTSVLADGPHSISATQTDAAGNTSDASTNISITTNDGDGVSPAIEDEAPNNGDGNNDGIADKLQSNVASILNPVSNNYTTLVGNGDCAQITSLVIDSAVQVNTNQDLRFPAGLVSFSSSCAIIGGSMNIELIFMGEYDLVTAKLQKLTGSNMIELPDVSKSLVVIGGQNGIKFSYIATDGGVNDQDGATNGTIVDPIGLSLPVNSTPTPVPTSTTTTSSPTSTPTTNPTTTPPLNTLIRTGRSAEDYSTVLAALLILTLGGIIVLRKKSKTNKYR